MHDLNHVIASFLHIVEHNIFDTRNLHEKNLAASWYDTCKTFSYKFSFLICIFVFIFSLLVYIAHSRFLDHALYEFTYLLSSHKFFVQVTLVSGGFIFGSALLTRDVFLPSLVRRSIFTLFESDTECMHVCICDLYHKFVDMIPQTTCQNFIKFTTSVQLGTRVN